MAVRKQFQCMVGCRNHLLGHSRLRIVLLICLVSLSRGLAYPADPTSRREPLPSVPDGFAIELVAREPLVRNPCAMAFDARGRLFVGMGPQYRNPRPDTPGDSVVRLDDADGDGQFDRKTVFATGLNCIQGLAWHADALWIANAPDLTMVRDRDGDDVADEYTLIYTDLGNLEHGLHGLNWAPDGRLYMSKGNSKGLNQPGRIAPRAFRELWGTPTLPGSPDIPPPLTFAPADYRNTYHNPADDWGREGGVLVCDNGGRNLEIISRGFRNPWDIAFDDGFHWQGTDNDQNQGDRVFMPFRGAHFGWGHSWSAHWTGQGHLPTAPISGPVFHGSGTGIVYYNAEQFPDSYRGVWFFNDWLRKTTFCYRSSWTGGLLEPEGGAWQEFIRGGDALFKPTDIAVGPQGALYVLGWGTEYGVKWDDRQQQMNEGRVFRVTWTRASEAPDPSSSTKQRKRPLSQWPIADLLSDFDGPLPVRRTNAQTELIRRGSRIRDDLVQVLSAGELSTAQETWGAWTLAQMAIGDPSVDRLFSNWATDHSRPNLRIQSARILGHRARTAPKNKAWIGGIAVCLNDPDPRIRCAALDAIHRAAPALSQPLAGPIAKPLIDRLAQETDRVTFYAAWQALRRLVRTTDLQALLNDQRAGVRRAALLALAETRQLPRPRAESMLQDTDPQIRSLSALWLAKSDGNPLLVVEPPTARFHSTLSINVTPGVKPATVRFTTDGSAPGSESRRWTGTLKVTDSTTLKLALFSGGSRLGEIAVHHYEKLDGRAAALHSGIYSLVADSGQSYRVAPDGLQPEMSVYTDRNYVFQQIPDSLRGSAIIQTANDDSGSRGTAFVKLATVTPLTVYVGHDTRIGRRPDWLADSASAGFSPTEMTVRTSDATFALFQKSVPAGEFVLGGNTVDGIDGGKSNYLIILRPEPLPRLKTATTTAAALSAMQRANAERGRALFYAARGATCARCHPVQPDAAAFGPQLSHLARRNDARHIIESVIKPSAHITEGFTTRVIVDVNGRALTGILREQTAQAVTLLHADGRQTVVPTDQIETSVSHNVSPMPSFEHLLAPQQVADLCAWLLSQRQAKPTRWEPQTAQFTFQQQPDRLLVRLNGRPWATYLFRHKQLTRPAWIHVHTPGGLQVTRNFPPRLPEDRGATDHALMHPGIWISFGDLNGNDYWRLQAKTQHLKFAQRPTAKPGQAEFTVVNHYLAQSDQSLVCRERTHYTLQARPEGVLMLIDARFQSSAGDFYFGDQEESGLAFRIASPFRVQGGNGTILNDRGQRNGQAIWGKQAKWLDYFGTQAKRRAGIMVVPSPHNARPCWMHARDYGVVASNPFPKQPRERRTPYVKTTVKQGTEYRLVYGLLIHELPQNTTLDHEKVYADVLRQIDGLDSAR